MTSHATVSRTFKMQVNATGSMVCAVDTPSTVLLMAASTRTGQCGIKCNVDQFCEFFHFKENLAQCEMFLLQFNENVAQCELLFLFQFQEDFAQCELFLDQFNEHLAQCELFEYSPSNFSTIDHCTAYATPPGEHN